MKKKKCVICKKKYIPIYYAIDIIGGIPRRGYIEILSLSCGKCPKCAWECYSNHKYGDCPEEVIDDDDDYEGELECSFFHNKLSSGGYGLFGDYINFYDINGE